MKTREEVLLNLLGVQGKFIVEGNINIPINIVYEAMEEYANQFKSIDIAKSICDHDPKPFTDGWLICKKCDECIRDSKQNVL